jgi:hypothetical protein
MALVLTGSHFYVSAKDGTAKVRRLASIHRRVDVRTVVLSAKRREIQRSVTQRLSAK